MSEAYGYDDGDADSGSNPGPGGGAGSGGGLLSASNMFSFAGGLGAVGGLLKGIGDSIAAGRKATALDHAALQSSEEAGVNAQTALMQGDATAATGAVRAAANGGGLVGSSMGVIANLSDQAMFNARAQIYRGNVERQNDLYEAAVTRAQGWSSLVGDTVGGVTSMLGGFANAAQASQLAAAGV
jgi:hypothetical protein